jgi:hypothetical protein
VQDLIPGTRFEMKSETLPRAIKVRYPSREKKEKDFFVKGRFYP